MNRLYNIIRLLTISVLLLSAAKPADSKVISIDESLKKIPLGTLIEYLEDEKGTLGFKDIRSSDSAGWTAAFEDNLGFGFTDSVYWMRFTIQNKTGREKEFFIDQEYSLIDNIKLYAPERGGYRIIEVGDLKPFGERPYPNRSFVFPLGQEGGSTMTYYMRYSSTSSMSIVLRLWSPEEFKQMERFEYWLLMIFHGIILIMVMYNLLLFFILRRKDSLYFVFFMSFYLLFMMSLNGTAFQFLWPDSPWFANFSVPVILMLVMLFCELFARELSEVSSMKNSAPYRMNIFITSTGSIIACVIFLIMVMILPYSAGMITASLWTGFHLILLSIQGLRIIIKERNRPTIIFVAAASAPIVGALAFVLKTFAVLPANFFTEWAVHIGSVFMVIINSVALADRMNSMSYEKQKTEMKYQELVESSDDIIFALDDELKFISVNRAMTNHLGYAAEEILGASFLDLIHDTMIDGRQMSRLIVDEYISALKKTGMSASFRANFKSHDYHEPKELSVRLKYIGKHGEKEKILGKATLIADDIILKSLKMEKHIYEVENFIYNAELLSQRLTRNLSKILNVSEIGRIRLGLREILINSIEHGNLNINYDEKTAAMNAGNYLGFIEERQKDPRYRNRHIHIEYLLTDKSAEYTILDNGEGFNHAAMIKQVLSDTDETQTPNGRGLIIVMQTFDGINFNTKGNQVTLTKYFKKSSADAAAL